jgi:hypothetical protein
MTDKDLLKESLAQSWLGLGVLVLFFISIYLDLSNIIIGAWLKAGLKIYPTAIIPIVWIIILYAVL